MPLGVSSGLAKEMDGQHSVLLAGFTRLSRVARRLQDDERALALLMIDVHAHFRWEEEQMRQHGYPDVRRHVRDHELQLASLMELRQIISEHGEMPEPDIFSMLQESMERHIRSLDADFVEFQENRSCWDLRREVQEWSLETEMADLDEHELENS